MSEAQKRYDELKERIKKADAWFATASYEEQLKQYDAYRKLIVEIGEAEKALKEVKP
ncbi:MAG: hypothetical protein QMD11_11030 [Smithella sp.]|nr:hypothetical protein [Smithella sp.]